MNLRALTLRYMGWCPGVKSAARFIPDRDIPPSRIALMAVLAASVYVPSFLATQMALNAVGRPSDSLTEVDNGKPALAVSNGQLYIAMKVETSSMVDFQGPRYHGERVYLAKLNLNGTLEDKVEVLDLGVGSLSSSWDLLVTSDGRWFLTYKYRPTLESPPGHIYVIDSMDGSTWGEPIIVAERTGDFSKWATEAEKQKSVDPENPCLTEAGNGEVFLSFNNEDSVYYCILTPEDGWSPPVEIPMVAEEQSCFLDGEGRIAVIGVDRGDWLFGEPRLKGNPLTVMDDDGNWTEPHYLTYQQAIPMRGYHPRMIYSDEHGGYLLLTRDLERKLTVSFTPDLEEWNGVNFERVWDSSLVELPDGTLVLAYSSHATYGSPGEIYISTSDDAVSWTTPRKIEFLRDEEALNEASSMEEAEHTAGKTMASAVVSLAVSAVVVIIAFKGLHLGPGSQRNSMSIEGLTP